MTSPYQVMPNLPEDDYAALKADIAEHGVLVPVEVDEDGHLLDGHHRVRAWQELCDEGQELPAYPVTIRYGMSEADKRNHARRLNVLRRQLDKGQRDQVIVDMRQDGMSYRQIAEATGVHPTTVMRAMGGVAFATPETITGRDGKTYPATRRTETAAHRVETDEEAPVRSYPLTASNHISASEGYDGDEWWTPGKYVEAARRVMGGIDLDPASTPPANKTVQAARFYTKSDNGLDQPWAGRVFLNPPYSYPLVEKFTTRLIEQAEAGFVSEAIVLVNNSTDTDWFQALLSRYPACFTDGRVNFYRDTGEYFGTRQGQAFFYIGPNRDRFFAEFGAYGAVVEAVAV